MTLLSLASRQIWPQVLVVCHLKPSRLFLLHSEDQSESKKPAERLKNFFYKTGLLAAGTVSLVKIEYNDFGSIEKRLEDLNIEQQFDLDTTVLNFTGGNKLMATAGFMWAYRRGIKACYLERGNELFWFESEGNAVKTSSEKINGHITDELDPLTLLRCQLETSEVERDGQTLTLNDAGQNENEEKFFRCAANGNPMERYLNKDKELAEEQKKGDALEYLVAAVLLKLGVKKVQRGLRLKVRSVEGTKARSPHSEIDLLFNWNGRLWIVDCKDTVKKEQLVDNLSMYIVRPIHKNAQDLLQRIRNELFVSQTKAIKEDMIAARETGGLGCRVICVRKSNPGEEFMQFAKDNQIEVVLKKELVERLRQIIT